MDASIHASDTERAPVEPLDRYLDALASTDPTPGGGSAATIVAASAAALVEMVARITRRNAKYTAVHPLADELIARANSLRGALLLARTQDELVYGRVVTAQAMPKGSPEESSRRREALQATLAEAATAPLQAASLAVDVLVLAERALGLDNAQLVSDLGCAAEFAGAAFRASSYNVRINHAYLRDTALRARQATVLSELAQQVDRRLDAVRAALEKHDLGP